jgi:hypothetical protein
MEKKVTSHIVKGLIISAIIIIILYILIYIYELYEIKLISYIVSLPIIFIGIVISNILYSKQNLNKIHFGNLFAHGFITTCVVIAITSLYTILAFKILFPDMIDKIIKKQIYSDKNIKAEMIEPTINSAKKLILPLTLSFTNFFSAITGVVASLIGAALSLIGAAVSKKKTSPFENKPTI